MRWFTFSLPVVLLLVVPALAQQGGQSRLPKTDWEALGHGVWLASATQKGSEVQVSVSIPMWAPKPGLNGRDPEGPEDFVVSEHRAVLKGSDVQAYRKDGAMVPSKELPRLLAKEAPVLWARTRVDPYFLAVIKDDVLVLVVDTRKVFKTPGTGPLPAPGGAPLPTPGPAPSGAPLPAPRGRAPLPAAPGGAPLPAAPR